MKVGMIGLGAMGMGMANRLQQAGFLSGVYNRTPEKMEKFNVKHYNSPETLAADMNVVLICVSADKDVLDVVHAISRTIKPHSIVVDMSTVSSDTAKQAAICLAKQAVAFLDAPVSGGVEGAKNGTLSMMIGGDAAILDIIHPILACMATRIIHIGDIGSGQATKAINQIMAAGINQAVTEALAVAQAQNLPMHKVIEVISGGAAGNWFLQHRGLTMTQNNYNSGFKLALHHKDLNIAQNMAKQFHVATPLTD
ncbi:partial 3-hydroxyisobutyrate dehydrogenase, partial [Patescibacteria group bacterium]